MPSSEGAGEQHHHIAFTRLWVPKLRIYAPASSIGQISLSKQGSIVLTIGVMRQEWRTGAQSLFRACSCPSPLILESWKWSEFIYLHRHAVSKKKGLSITEKLVLVHYHDATLSTDLQFFLPCPLKSPKRLDCVPRAAQSNQCQPFLSTVNKATWDFWLKWQGNDLTTPALKGCKVNSFCSIPAKRVKLYVIPRLYSGIFSLT